MDLNATQAAIRDEYKEKAAYRTGAENLRKPQIQKEIQKRLQERQQRTEVSPDIVVKELAAIALYDGHAISLWWKSTRGVVADEPHSDSRGFTSRAVGEKKG